jgi:hypothetical protein
MKSVVVIDNAGFKPLFVAQVMDHGSHAKTRR